MSRDRWQRVSSEPRGRRSDFLRQSLLFFFGNLFGEERASFDRCGNPIKCAGQRRIFSREAVQKRALRQELGDLAGRSTNDQPRRVGTTPCCIGSKGESKSTGDFIVWHLRSVDILAWHVPHPCPAHRHNFPDASISKSRAAINLAIYRHVDLEKIGVGRAVD